MNNEFQRISENEFQNFPTNNTLKFGDKIKLKNIIFVSKSGNRQVHLSNHLTILTSSFFAPQIWSL